MYLSQPHLMEASTVGKHKEYKGEVLTCNCGEQG